MISKFLSLPASIKQGLWVFMAILLGVAIGRYTLPAKIVTKTETKTVIQQVKVESKNTTIKRNVDRIVSIKPDGTRTIETRDLSLIDDISRETDKDTSQSTAINSKEVTYSRPSLMVGLGLGVSGNALKDGAVYSAQLQKRVFGPLWLGVTGQTNGYGGLSLHIEF